MTQTDHIHAILPGGHLPELSYSNLNDKLLEKSPTPTLVAGTCLAKLLIGTKYGFFLQNLVFIYYL